MPSGILVPEVYPVITGNHQKRAKMAHRAYATEVGDWLDGLAPWDYWATFTYREARSLPAVRRSMERLADRLNPSLMFWGSEAGKITQRNHVHALLYFNSDELNFAPPAAAIWKLGFSMCGRSHVDQFDPELGASHYVSKYVSKTLSDWDIR